MSGCYPFASRSDRYLISWSNERPIIKSVHFLSFSDYLTKIMELIKNQYPALICCQNIGIERHLYIHNFRVLPRNGLLLVEAGFLLISWALDQSSWCQRSFPCMNIWSLLLRANNYFLNFLCAQINHHIVPDTSDILLNTFPLCFPRAYTVSIQ